MNIKQKLRSWMSKTKTVTKDIHAQLEDTIAERKIILQQWERLFHLQQSVTVKDIHGQLLETIARHKEIKHRWKRD